MPEFSSSLSADVVELRLYAGHDIGQSGLAHVRVLSLDKLPRFIYVQLPSEYIHPPFMLTGVKEVTLGQSSEDITSKILCYVAPAFGFRSWLKIPTSTFNTTPGFHKYVFSFTNLATEDIFDRLLCYSVQTDNPDKPYIYMPKSE